jgi:hypothetical protein
VSYTHGIIPLTDKYRIIIEQDEWSPECPLDWTDSGYVSIRKPYLSEHLTVDPLGTADHVRMIADQLSDPTLKIDHEAEIEKAIIKHYARQGYVAKRLHPSGYSQNQWHVGFIYVPQSEAEYIDSIGDTFERWYCGDVFSITLEELVTYRRVDDPEQERSEWEFVEAIGGVYDDKPADIWNTIKGAIDFELTPDRELEVLQP